MYYKCQKSEHLRIPHEFRVWYYCTAVIVLAYLHIYNIYIPRQQFVKSFETPFLQNMSFDFQIISFLYDSFKSSWFFKVQWNISVW